MHWKPIYNERSKQKKQRLLRLCQTTDKAYLRNEIGFVSSLSCLMAAFSYFFSRLICNLVKTRSTVKMVSATIKKSMTVWMKLP